MKIWELISELSKYKAGAEVVIALPETNCVAVNNVDELDEDYIAINGASGGMLVDYDGNEVKLAGLQEV